MSKEKDDSINIADIEKIGIKIASALTQYGQEVSDKVKKIVDGVAKETVEELKRTSPKRTGRYAQEWKQKKLYENSLSRRRTVYNDRRRNITHLLEKEHDDRTKTKTIYPKASNKHIGPANEHAIEKLQERIEGALK